MKYWFSFLLGVGVGAGGTFLWLHKYIKDELDKKETVCEVGNSGEEAKEDGKTETEENKSEDDGENTAGIKSDIDDFNGAVVARKAERVAYDKVTSVYTNVCNIDIPNGQNSFVYDNMVNPAGLAMPRDLDGHFVDNSDAVFEIDYDTFREDRDNEKERLTWFRGDGVMATEDGTVITNPAMLVGSNWMDWVNHYATNTAFVRNGRLCTDYEIYVEDGLYVDEYRPYEEG